MTIFPQYHLHGRILGKNWIYCSSFCISAGIWILYDKISLWDMCMSIFCSITQHHNTPHFILISFFSSFPIFVPYSLSLCWLSCPGVLDTVRPCHDRVSLCSFLFFSKPFTSPVTGEWEEKEGWSGVRGGRMDLLTWASGSGRCITVRIMVDDEASGCQGQLHTEQRCV